MGKVSFTTVKKAAVKKASVKKVSANKVRKTRVKKPVFDGPLVSIVMPAYNAAKFIDGTIHSVLGQTYKNWELIVVDDHSVDNTLEVLKQFKSDKIKVIACKKNGGAVAATNRGIRAAKGKYLAFIDVNDVWQPNKLVRQFDFMRRNNAAFVFSSYVFADSKGRPNGRVKRAPEFIELWQGQKRSSIMTSTVMLDMKTMSKTDAKIEHGERKWLNALAKAGRAYGMREVTVIRGCNPGLSFFEKIRRGGEMNNNVNVSVSIVTYNSVEEIDGVLSSLYGSNLDGINIRVYVVDNNSIDDTIDIIEEKYPEVELIRNQKNIGFGAAHNLAIKKVSSKYHIIVNPDITFMENTIRSLVDYMENNLDVALITPKVLNDDEMRSEQFLPKKYPKIKYLIGGFFENRSKKCKKWRSEYTMQDRKSDAPCMIDFCTGCFMFCRTKTLKKVGGFDERYFLHFEDADLTRKIQEMGKTMFMPTVQVIHKWKRDNHGDKKILFITLKSMMIYYKKWNWRIGK